MTNRELIKFLKDHQDDPKLGGGFSHKDLWNDFAKKNSDYGFEENPESFNFTWKVYLDYFTHLGSKVMLRPVGAALMAFALIFGGWVTTVNASFGSVPGDFLYPVKLVTERMQISLATNNEQRARLHTEFAGRRLNEVMEIASSAREDKEVLVREAVESFKNSINLATTVVGNMVESSPEAAAEVAMIVDQKVEVMSSIITAGETNTSMVDHSKQLAEAQDSTKVSDQALTESIVISNEAVKKERTEGYLQDSFKKDLLEIDTRSASLLARLAVIEAAMADGSVSGGYTKNIEIITKNLGTFEDELIEARNYFAAGGWRRVLEIVTDLKTKLSTAEVLVAEMEIEISSSPPGEAP